MSTTDPTSTLSARLRAAPLAAQVTLSLLPLTVVTAAVAMLTDWRGRFTLSEDQGSVLSELAFNGSVISIPLPPLVVYVAAALLAMRRDRWQVLGLVLIALGGVVTIIGGMGELFAEPSVHTPRAVLLIAGPFYVLLGIAMTVLAVRDLVRRRPRR